MTEHTHTGKVAGNTLSRLRVLHLPDDWPVGAEVTVTWTEPPEPSGRWEKDGDTNIVWGYDDGQATDLLNVVEQARRGHEWALNALAALVDLIESDHLPPQMPTVEAIDEWTRANGYQVSWPKSWPNEPTTWKTAIRGARDAIAALTAHGVSS